MKIAIFYHVAQMGISAFVYQSQLHRLYTSGLIKEADYIHFGVNGDQELFNVPDKTIVKVNKNWKEETDTLISLKKFCDENPDYKVLYFHTKGVSRTTLSIDSWRLMMEYFVIDNWKECIDSLDQYNVAGCFLNNDPSQYTYFSGNFWWANASYIQSLNYNLLKSENRSDREYWIGSHPKFNPKEFHNLKEHHNSLYWDIYSEFNYIK